VKRFWTTILILLLPAAVWAAGGHDDLDCTGCHSLHDAKAEELIFAMEPNLESQNPRTGAAFTGVTSLCLSCHEETGGMGILPVSGGTSHPIGVAPEPRIANVPADLLRDGAIECVSCHDPHPSNPNYKYLRIDTAGGSQMKGFCSMCHASKSGTRADLSGVFTSMDERTPPLLAAGAPVSPAAVGSTQGGTEP